MVKWKEIIKIFYLNFGQWEPVDAGPGGGPKNGVGTLKYVSTSGKGWIWGINGENNQLWKCEKPCSGSPKDEWKWVEGPLLKEISGDGNEEEMTWGFSDSGYIYKSPNFDKPINL